MGVKRQPGARAQAAEYHRSEADVRHEMPVHHVEVQPRRPRHLHRRHLLGKAGEVEGKEGGVYGKSA